jgi:hypothetical protein
MAHITSPSLNTSMSSSTTTIIFRFSGSVLSAANAAFFTSASRCLVIDT